MRLAQISSKEVFRAKLANTLERRMFYVQSFRIYGGVSGLYDYGPPGCAVKQNVTQLWRQHFVLEENMLEVECPAVTPEVVLRASGHKDRFTDLMVTDVETGDCHRADHLLEGHLQRLLAGSDTPVDLAAEARGVLARVGDLTAQQLGAAITAYGVRAPDTQHDLSPPFPFNLMFGTSIGPRSDQPAYLRPETAQGIFVNFKDLLYYNGGKLPFAAAQVGQSYRNEIAPQQGLLRVREFTQAEIEHFCHPDDKRHIRFRSVADLAAPLLSRALQVTGQQAERMTLADALRQGTIANETLAYYIGRTYLFMAKVGIDLRRLRFRQHLEHEMAHYAEDCWDAEIHTSYGWIECAGLADRSAYDLSAHAAASKESLTAYERYDNPRRVLKTIVKPVAKAIGRTYRADAKTVQETLEQLPEDAALRMRDTLQAGEDAELVAGGKRYNVSQAMVDISQAEVLEHGRAFTPSVVEPSFGIGRILYCLFEHSFFMREDDEKRAVLSFTPVVAPTKASVFPLLQKPRLAEVATQIAAELRQQAVTCVVDTTGASIGKRYARTDELGVPFAITVDHESVLSDDSHQVPVQRSVTLRERNSTAQVRVPLCDIVQVVKQLSHGHLTWEDVLHKYPA